MCVKDEFLHGFWTTFLFSNIVYITSVRMFSVRFNKAEILGILCYVHCVHRNIPPLFILIYSC